MAERFWLTLVRIFNQTTARSCRAALILLFLAPFGFVAGTPNNAQTSGTQLATISASVQTNFGSALEAETSFKPFYVTGDFNGDAIQDLAVVVRVKKARRWLPKDVRILNPFELERRIVFPANPATDNKLALAIIHGWRSPTPSAKFLLIGDSPILVLDYQRVTSDQPGDRQELIAIMRKRGRRSKGETFPRAARGDVILLGNQVGDNSPLYWNGQTYIWEDSAED